MTSAEAKLLERYRITIAIDDPRLGQIRMWIGARIEYLDCGHIHGDVVAQCLWLERKKGEMK
jgi:hypothetical protein